jgi:hypothetical protein
MTQRKFFKTITFQSASADKLKAYKFIKKDTQQDLDAKFLHAFLIATLNPYRHYINFGMPVRITNDTGEKPQPLEAIGLSIINDDAVIKQIMNDYPDDDVAMTIATNLMRQALNVGFQPAINYCQVGEEKPRFEAKTAVDAVNILNAALSSQTNAESSESEPCDLSCLQPAPEERTFYHYLLVPAEQRVSLKPKEHKQEEASNSDSLYVIKKIFNLVYNKEAKAENFSAQDLKKYLPSLKNLPRNQEFWKLICEGFLSGKGKEFFNLMREAGVFQALFPSVENLQQQKLDFIAWQVEKWDQSLATKQRPLFGWKLYKAHDPYIALEKQPEYKRPHDAEVNMQRVFALLVAQQLTEMNAEKIQAAALNLGIPAVDSDLVRFVESILDHEQHGFKHAQAVCRP